jgi:hypothetical protein
MLLENEGLSWQSLKRSRLFNLVEGQSVEWVHLHQIPMQGVKVAYMHSFSFGVVVCFLIDVRVDKVDEMLQHRSWAIDDHEAHLLVDLDQLETELNRRIHF